MSEKTKRYWWLKLREGFFDQTVIKKLRRMAGGDTYTIIYLEMQLLSLKNAGALMFENVEDTFAEELALRLDEPTDDVQVTLLFLQKHGLIEIVKDGEYLLPEAVRNIDSESDSAARVRNFRERKAAQTLQSNGEALQCASHNVTCNTDIEKEKEIDTEKEKIPPVSPKGKSADKTQYAEFVTMTEKEYNSLCERVGERGAKRCIEILDNYKGANGKKYASDYHAILSWVIAKYNEEPQPEPEEPTEFAYPTPEENVLTEIESGDTLADLLDKINTEEVRK